MTDRPSKPSAEEAAIIDPLIQFYESQSETLEHATNSIQSLLLTSRELQPFRHSIRLRTKSTDSMRGKLLQKLRRAKSANEDFKITEGTFFARINDAIGARFLHLSVMSEFAGIHAALTSLFSRESFLLLEKPKAYTWDNEYMEFFEKHDVKAEVNPRFYTSVHYIIAPNNRIPWSAEIQVRTLAEELWGEVDHRFNYPEKHRSRACRDQILTLARVVSGCTRLVDSIFQTNADHTTLVGQSIEPAARPSSAPPKKNVRRRRRKE